MGRGYKGALTIKVLTLQKTLQNRRQTSQQIVGVHQGTEKAPLTKEYHTAMKKNEILLH